MFQKNDDTLMLNDWASENAISKMEWSPGSPGSHLPLSCEYEGLSKPTHQNETPSGNVNTSMAEEATIPLSGTGMAQTRGPGPLGQFQKHFTKPLVPFLTMAYLHAESILQAARSVRVFHMQSLYIARQALHLVVLLNDLVDPEEGPDDTEQVGRFDLEDDLIELVEAMENWGACSEGGSVDREQHLLKIQHHYTQIFKERFYFHDVRDYANDIIYQKLLAYDERTIEKRQRCQIASNIIQVDYWITSEEQYFEDQEEPEATPEIGMASGPTLGSTCDAVGDASAAHIEAVGGSSLERGSTISADESNSEMKTYGEVVQIPAQWRESSSTTTPNLRGNPLADGLSPLTPPNPPHLSFLYPDTQSPPAYALQDDNLRLFSTQGPQIPNVLSHYIFPLESNAGPPLGTATSTTAYIGSASGHHDDPDTGHHHDFSTSIHPVTDSGYGSNLMFDALVPHPMPEHVVRGMRRMRLNSEASIPHPEFASQQPSVASPPTGHGSPRYASPEKIEANGPSAFPVSAYGGNDDPTQYEYPLENGTQSWGEQRSTWTHEEAVSGHNHHSMLPLYSDMGHQSGGVTTTPSYYGGSMTMMFDQIPDRQFSLEMSFPAYAHYGQAAPATMHPAGEGNITAGSFAPSDERYNYPLQQPASVDDKVRHSTATIATRAHRVTSSWQNHSWAPSSSTTTSFPGGVALKIPSHNLRAIQHRNSRQRNASSILTYRELDSALQGTASAPDGGHFAASASAFTDEDRADYSPTPATCLPMTELNTQKLLMRVLGPSPRLKNEALIQLILLILHAPFYRMNEMEPTRDSEEGRALLKQMHQIPDCPPGTFDWSTDSIFTLFVSHSKLRCLICLSSKQSMVRGVGCVRSHLNHRPFPCLGEDGCESCPKGQIVKRFFTASLLHDHCSKQERPIDCTYCGRVFASNIKHHWDSKHKHTPFPYDNFPNYVPE